MPIIKTQRTELVIRQPEWEETLTKAKGLYGLWLSAWLAICCIFGKRRNEICRLRYRDVYVSGEYLFVRFYVGKKKFRSATIDKMPYLKKITLKHYAAPYIVEYLKEFHARWYSEFYMELLKRYGGFPNLIHSIRWNENKYSGQKAVPEYEPQLEEKIKPLYLFPSKRKPSELIVHTKLRNGKGEFEVREYHYHVDGGYMSGSDVYNMIKKVNPQMWPHLGRHTVATEAAENGATEYDISNIIDVSPRTASKYVHHGTKLTERWSERTA